MAKKSNLPAEAHDHFQKANVLHKYVQEHLEKASKYALEIGDKLLAAKKTIPHGSWEKECCRLFDGSLRTAQFYMQFSRNMGVIPKAQNRAILMVEGTLDGAAKAAKKAAKAANAKKESNSGKAQESVETIDVDSDPTGSADEYEGRHGNCSDPFDVSEDPFGNEEEYVPPVDPEAFELEPEIHGDSGKLKDYGKCPNCAGTKWAETEEGVFCKKCKQPWGEPSGGVDDERLNTQRQKTCKTVEALMRAFDDLNTMKARREHKGIIEQCALLLKMAKEWK